MAGVTNTLSADLGVSVSLSVSNPAKVLGTVQNLHWWEFVNWEAFMSSFLAILMAGLIITCVNQRFLVQERQNNRRHQQKERRQNIADMFCVKLEDAIFDYFGSVEEEKKKAERKILALFEAFLLFIQNDPSTDEDPEIQDHLGKLWNFNLEEDSKEEERMTRALCAIAMIRYRLTR